jgi:hypothetical protein
MTCGGKGQSLTFAGANAHHWNRIAERRIRKILQELARTMLVHGNKRWPKAVTKNSWPCALRMMANDVLIETPLMQNKEKLSPHQLFSNARTQPNPKHWKQFGCPVHVLDSSIQGGRGTIHKWKQRWKVGTCLGPSPQHARSVALALDRQTASVSPHQWVQGSSMLWCENFFSCHGVPLGKTVGTVLFDSCDSARQSWVA